jgi:hypothetical protein
LFAELLEEDTWDAHISVDAQRVFIQFHQEGNPEQKKQITSSKVCLPVYLAVKLSKLGKKFKIRLTDKDEAEQYVRHVEESAKKLLDSTLSDVESLASGRSGRSEVPYVLQIPPTRLPEMKELIETFEPQVLWSDGDWEAPPGVNFINILRVPFLYKSALRSFSLVVFWLWKF